MLNLIKMDLYRMFHSLSTWIIILFTAGMALFCVVMVQGDLDAMADDPAYAQEMEQEAASASDGNEDRQIGLYSESDPEWIEGRIDAGEFISSQLQSGLLTLFVVIFAAIFANAEQKNGYVKNIAGQLTNRGTLALSKLAASAVQVFIMLLVFSLAAGVMGKILWGGRFSLRFPDRYASVPGSTVSAEPGDRRSDPFPLYSDKEFRIQYDGGDCDGDGAFRSAVFYHQQSVLRDTSFLEL